MGHQSSSDGIGPIPHRSQTQARSGFRIWSEPFAIILDSQGQMSIIYPEFQLQPARLAMRQRVMDRLLRNPIERQTGLRIDVRRKGAYEAAPELIEGAVWRDPEKVDEWAGELTGAEVVVYCVYGHEVGQSTAARLRDAGVAAHFLSGGIEDWKKAGRPVTAKP